MLPLSLWAVGWTLLLSKLEQPADTALFVHLSFVTEDKMCQRSQTPAAASPSCSTTLGINQLGADCSPSPALWLSSATGRLIFNLTDTLFTPENLL